MPISHAVVIRPASAFWRDPGDDLIWVLNVAGLAVYAVRWIQADALAVWRRGIVEHLVHIRWTEVLARTAVLADTARLTNIGVLDDQVRGLVFLMLRARVIEIGKLVERQPAIALGRAEQMSFRAAIGWQVT